MMNKKQYTCCFTGHRKIAPEQQPAVIGRLKKTVEQLIVDGYCYFGTGGALGFDTLAAQCVLPLKKQYPHIRLILVLPCLEQSKHWPAQDVAVFENIKASADKVVCLSDRYTRDCMFKRNRYLVDHSRVCVAYLIHPWGGTAYTVEYARRKGVQVIDLAEYFPVNL